MDQQIESTSSEMSDAQMDAAIAGDTGSRDIPMSAPKEAPQTSWKEDAFNWNGKEVKGTREQILKWANQGYNYSQKAAELNQMQAAIEKQKSEYENRFKENEQKWSPYKEVDEYAAKNPDWWTQTQAAYKSRSAQAGTNPDVNALKQEIMDQLKPFQDFMQSSLSEKQSQKVLAEDQALSTEIDDIKKTYKHIDFDTPDDDGHSLEMKVLKHAETNNISNFRAAFRDYYHDQLVSKAQEQGKETVSKELQKRTKMGIVSESMQPTRGLTTASNTKNKSYNDLAIEGLEELRAGKL